GTEASPEQFEIRHEDGNWRIRDSGSPEGTRVEGSRLEGDWRNLTGGEWIYVGRNRHPDFIFDVKNGTTVRRGPFNRAEAAVLPQGIHDEVTAKIRMPQAPQAP